LRRAAPSSFAAWSTSSSISNVVRMVKQSRITNLMSTTLEVRRVPEVLEVLRVPTLGTV
jgi:hypothetical protein